MHDMMKAISVKMDIKDYLLCLHVINLIGDDLIYRDKHSSQTVRKTGLRNAIFISGNGNIRCATTENKSIGVH